MEPITMDRNKLQALGKELASKKMDHANTKLENGAKPL